MGTWDPEVRGRNKRGTSGKYPSHGGDHGSVPVGSSGDNLGHTSERSPW